MIDRTTFLAARKQGVGGSDIASVFNVGYGCRRRLWFDKTNTPKDFPREETKAMALGSYMEAWFAELYAKETGRELSPVITAPFFRPEIPELKVNTDRMFRNAGEVGRDGVLEIKSCGRGAFYKYKREGLPHDYILQLQAGMVASGLSWGSFAIGCRDNGELLHWDVDRNDALCAEIIAEVPRFWATVEAGRTWGSDAEVMPVGLVPDRLEPDDRRCQSCEFRTMCQGKALIQIAPQSEYTPDESLRPLVAEYIERRSLAKEATEMVDETKSELQALLGSRGMVTAGGAKIQYYEIEKKEYIVKAHKERPLRVYEAKK